MLAVRVALNENGYDIVIGQHILKNLPERMNQLAVGKDVVIVTNPVIQKKHGNPLAKSLRQYGYTVKVITVPSGEKSKSARVAFKVIQEIAAYGGKKNTVILALGGGVVGDLAGYVAAVYKRGIPYIQIPTTLLAQIDSAIGGKVAIDLPFGKNLVGAFYQPKVVWSDIAVLSTLDKRQVRNGLAEAVKYGIISDKNLFEFIDQHAAELLALEPAAVKEVVLDCSKIKARVVTSDEKETKGIRTILNFGHTVGHAIETADQYRNYHHGEAIALGMRVAVDISCRMALLSKSDAQRINRVLSKLELPEKIQRIQVADIMDFMAYDKKFQAGKNKFVLATGIGSVKVVEGVDRNLIRAAIQACR